MDALRLPLIALILAMPLPRVAAADAAAADDSRVSGGGGWVFTSYAENDSNWAKPNNDSDEHYTNGLVLTLSSQPEFARDWAHALPLGPSPDTRVSAAAGLLFGHLMFTSQNIEDPTPSMDDRPYAGYLFGGAYWQRAWQELGNPRVATFDHIQLELGVIGPSSLAADVQESVHESFAGIEPEGWDTQLEDEFAIQAYLRRKWRFDLDEPGGWDVQVIPGIGAAVGLVHRHLEAGATLRGGWNLPDDFGPGRLADFKAATGDRPGNGWGFYVYGRAAGRAVEHNVFLEGSNYHDSPGVEPEPLVGEVEAGVRIAWHGDCWGLEFGYGQTFQTREFKTERGTDSRGAYTASLFFLF